MHLVLDTNILHQETLSSVNMKTLARVSNSGFLKVWVPSLVKREYVTKVAGESESQLQSAIGNLDKLLKSIRGSRCHSRLNEIRGHLEELKLEITSTYEQDFDEWRRVASVQLLEFDPNVMGSVMDRYFTGSSPFRSSRARGDIVDAMISAAIEALVVETGPVYVAVKDGLLRNHLAQTAGVSVFDGIGAFLQQQPVHAEILRLDVEEDVSRYLARLSTPAVRAALVEHILGNQTVLDQVYVEEEAVTGIDELGIESSFGLRVNGPDVGQTSSLQLGAISYLGRKEYSFRFDMKATARVDYCGNYSDYLELSDTREKAIHVSSMNGAGLCDFEEDRTVLVAGTLTLDLADISLEELNRRLANGPAGFTDFGIEVDASSATVLPAQPDIP